VLVGDHPLYDVVGAKRAGWYAVWLDRDGENAGEAGGAFWQLHDGDERPDAVVSSLSDLQPALDGLDSG
jgi:FMN phosphatase YigB (HAD superfamily)